MLWPPFLLFFAHGADILAWDVHDMLPAPRASCMTSAMTIHFFSHYTSYGRQHIICFPSGCCIKQDCITARKCDTMIAKEYELADHLFVFLVWLDILCANGKLVPVKQTRSSMAPVDSHLLVLVDSGRCWSDWLPNGHRMLSFLSLDRCSATSVLLA